MNLIFRCPSFGSHCISWHSISAFVRACLFGKGLFVGGSWTDFFWTFFPSNFCETIWNLLLGTRLSSTTELDQGGNSQGSIAWNTVIIWIPDKSSIWKVLTCLKTEQKMSVLWSQMSYSNDQTIWKPGKKYPKSGMLGFQVFGIQMVTLMFSHGLKIMLHYILLFVPLS